jgi:hypothetical protein
MVTKRFSIDLETLFKGVSETIALLYDEQGGQQGNIVDENGNIVYVNEKHLYEQVEYFNDIDELNKRKELLSKISNRAYTNFRIHYKK